MTTFWSNLRQRWQEHRARTRARQQGIGTNVPRALDDWEQQEATARLRREQLERLRRERDRGMR